jgi:DNA-binding Lrp family transcriptional regulator
MKLELVKKIEREVAKLDSLDEAILGVLSYNARLSESKIAKILQTSKQNVNYRLKKLREYQIYTGARTIINRKLLGLEKVHYFLTMHNSKLHIPNSKHPRINAHLEFSGYYTHELACMAKSIEEIRATMQLVLSELESKNIQCTLRECIISKTIVNNPFPVLKLDKRQLRGEAFESDIAKAKEKKIKLDEIDYELIRVLSINGSKSLTELGKSVNLTHDAVRLRIKRLIKNKYILGFTPAISYERLGFMMTAILVEKKHEQNWSKLYDTNVIWAALSEHETIIYYLHYSVADLIEYLKTIDAPYHLLSFVKRHKYRYLSDLR